jgi:hypothetical protein
MQGICKVINKVIRTKEQGTLAFNRSCSEFFNLLLFEASRTRFTLGASIIGTSAYKENKQAN